MMLSGNKRPQTDSNVDEDFGTDYVVQVLEKIETELRIKHIPSMVQRAPPVEFDDIHEFASTDNTKNTSSRTSSNQQAIIIQDKNDGAVVCSLKKFNLRSFSISMIVPPPPSNELSTSFLTKLTTLDLSHNEIMDIPGLGLMLNLQILNVERGWFNTLPTEIGSLKQLHTLNASRNFLRPNTKSLRLDQLKTLSHLKTLDLTYNQKCGTTAHLEFISSQLPQIRDIKATLWEEVGSVPGSYVGKSASERDPRLLRSQLGKCTSRYN